MATIKGVLITAIAPMSDHIANGGEKILGNASSIKRRPDGRVYISGQKQRHALFSAIDGLNNGTNNTRVTNGDGISAEVETDLRADLGGFLHTSKESYSGRRSAPVTATPAVARDNSEIGRDLLIRLKVLAGNDESSKGQALATREFSQDDLMVMSFHIDVGAVSFRKYYKYGASGNVAGVHMETRYARFADEQERRRRIRLALEGTSALTEYANNARNATSAEPQKVVIAFDTRLSRKACRYFKQGVEETEQRNMIAEIEGRGGTVFFGDDTDPNVDSVATAYQKALDFLGTADLFDPAPDAPVMTTEAFATASNN
jgi:CRISPR-associated protein Cst2